MTAENNSEKIALALRNQFERGFPKVPWEDGLTNAYEFAKIVQEQTGLSFKEADELAAKVAPELYWEYWREWLENNDIKTKGENNASAN